MSRSGAECAPNDSHCFAIGRPPVHNEFHEAGKTLIEVFDADSAASLEPVLPLSDDTRLPERFEVMGEARLRPVEAEPPQVWSYSSELVNSRLTIVSLSGSARTPMTRSRRISDAAGSGSGVGREGSSLSFMR